MGSKKKQTIGYKYHLWIHKALCAGPIDLIKAIDVDRRPVWSGLNTGGSITLDKKALFGGDRKEGGISGVIDVLMGGADQLQNTSLQSFLGTDIPAFKGVVCVLLKDMYLSMNPYLKPWRYRGQRVYTGYDGNPQWLPGKAGIADYEDMAIYIALDTSGSMDTLTGNGETRLTNAKNAIKDLLESLEPVLTSGLNIDISIVGWDTTTDSESFYNLTIADITTANAHVDTLNSVGGGGTDFEVGLSLAPAFFTASGKSKKIITFISDGVPTDGMPNAIAARALVDSIPDVSCYAFNIDYADTSFTEVVDNTNNGVADPVPNVSGDSDELLGVMVQAIGTQVDMNPAHIIRECMLSPEFGLGYLESDINLDSFGYAANLLFNEGMGLSLLWDRQIPVIEFIQEIIRHTTGVLDVNPNTGKYEYRLIRGDYNAEELLVLNENNCRIKNYTKQAVSGDGINSVTVQFWNHETGEDASVTVDDLASISEQGGVVANTVRYPGFTKRHLATQAAQRDLFVYTSKLVTCTLIANREASALRVGSVFKFEWAKKHSGYIIMRVMDVSYGDSKSNQVKIKAVQDVFSLPQKTYVAQETNEFVDITSDPEPAEYRVVIELPYYELVQNLGHTEADAKLADNNEIGFLGSSCARPAGAPLNYILAVDAGAGYEEAQVGDFCPVLIIPAEVDDLLETTITYSSAVDADLITIGSVGYWGEEIVRIDDINTTTLEITLGRGCLDTVPTSHPENSTILWYDELILSDEVEYVDGETLNVKLLISSTSGVLPSASAPTDIADMRARAFRPYPPGQFRLGGEYYPAALLGEFTVTWVHRNRVQQTAGTVLDFESGTVSPEVGTTYEIDIYDATSNTLITTKTGFTGETATIGIVDLAGLAEVRLELFSVREGYRSFKGHTHSFSWSSGAHVIQFVDSYTPPDDDSVDLQFTE